MASWMMVWPGMLALRRSGGILGGLLEHRWGFWPFRCWRCCLAWIRPRRQGTALVMIAPNVVLAFWRYSQHPPDCAAAGADAARGVGCGCLTRRRDWRCRWIITPALDFHRLFAVAGGLSGLAAARPSRQGAPAPAYCPRRWLPLVSVVAGAFSGLFTVGGGTISSPMLVGLFGYRQAAAQGLGLCMIVPSSLVAMGATPTPAWWTGSWAFRWRLAGCPPSARRGAGPAPAGSQIARDFAWCS